MQYGTAIVFTFFGPGPGELTEISSDCVYVCVCHCHLTGSARVVCSGSSGGLTNISLSSSSR